MRWRLLLALPLAVRVLASSESVETRQRAREALEGRVVRTTFGATEDPYLFEDSLGEEEYTGVLVDFLDQLRKEVGFLVEIVDVSNESLRVLNTSNRNTACARDVSLNKTDLCVGNSWVTTQRLLFAKVLPTLWQESLELGVAKTRDTSFRSALIQAFLPFDPLLWIAIGVVIFLYAVLAWWAESRENNRDFPDKSVFASGMTSLYHGLFGFFWSEPPTRPVTAEGRVLAVGFGFFTLIMLSSYTASLASVLVSDNDAPEFESLQDAIANNARVCMWDSVQARADRLYPGLANLSVFMDSNEAGYNMLASGKCNAILVDPIFHAKAQERAERDCDKELVGGPIIDINCAWPAADWLVAPLSLFIADLVDKGVLDDLKRVYSPRVLCEDSSSQEADGLDIQNVSGVFFIIGAFLVAAGIVHMCKRSVRQGKKSDSFHRLSEKMRRRRTQASSSTSSDKRVSTTAAAVPAEPAPVPKRSSISGVLRHSARSDTSLAGLDREDPGHAMVLAFRSEKRLKEMPFEKALLVIGNAQAKADQEIMEALREVKEIKALRSSGGAHGEDFEFTDDSLPPPTAAKLHESKPLSHPDNHRDSAILHESKPVSHPDNHRDSAKLHESKPFSHADSNRGDAALP